MPILSDLYETDEGPACTITSIRAEFMQSFAVKTIVIKGTHDLTGKKITIRLLTDQEGQGFRAHDPNLPEDQRIPDCTAVFNIKTARPTILGNITHEEAVHTGFFSRTAFIAMQSTEDMEQPVTIVTLDMPEPAAYYKTRIEENLAREDRTLSDNCMNWARENLRTRNQEHFLDLKIN